MYERMLLPVDGSEVSNHAAEEGFKLAAILGSQATLLFVIDMTITSLPGEESGLANYEVVYNSFKEYGGKILDTLVESGKKRGVSVRTAIAEGDVHDEIIKYADLKKVNLIVMGTHGRRGLNRLLLGSVAGSVTRRAHCPVLLIRPE